MSEQQNNGGPAFPSENVSGNSAGCPMGMTLRDWFAGQALAGLSVHRTSSIWQRFRALLGLPCTLGRMHPQPQARVAYEYADAMLEAREASQ